MKVKILGSDWKIVEHARERDEKLVDCTGYCDWSTREIVIEKDIAGNLGNMDAYIRKVKRHEIVHAFLFESGLHECSGETEAWSFNETMVDWFAIMGERIYKAWQDAGAV